MTLRTQKRNLLAYVPAVFLRSILRRRRRFLQHFL